jgi:hypothetical protein
MRIYEFITESSQGTDPSNANWARIMKNQTIWPWPSVEFYALDKETPPFSSGRISVWFKKVGNEWQEYGDHGKYDYSDILRKSLQL